VASKKANANDSTNIEPNRKARQTASALLKFGDTSRMFLPKVLLTIAILLDFALLSRAGEAANFPEIGTHYAILVVEKNVNPQNKLVIYTKMDANGRFSTDSTSSNQPVFGFYWLMDSKDYKPVNATIKSEIRKRFESQWSSGDLSNRFCVNVNDLKEVNSDIKEPKMDVYARSTGGKQSVEAEMNLGPSDGHMRIRLFSIYTEGRAFPPAVYSVTLIGEEILNGNVTGKKITRRYSKR